MGFLNVLENVLKKDGRFVAEDGKLLKPIVYTSAMKMDKSLIALLIENQQTKEHFFTDVSGVLVFDKIKFGWVVDSKEFLPDSYTSYKNKIGLVDNNGHLLSAKEDVTLVWPYKDCILEGGQTKDDQKRNEIFYNETLAPDEVKRLLHPKVLTDAKRYTKDGAEYITAFDDKDNLIIKGNNLLALSSLLVRYEGKVKCIYIDPPFNTGNDSFNYNDRFTRSTWLTFMKSRLLLARKLLTNDGSLFLHIDENHSHYLKVLCDEIFGEENFMNEIIWRYRTYIGQVKEYFPKKHDTIFWYKNKDRPEFVQMNQGNFEETPDYNRWKAFLSENGEIIYGNHPTTDTRFAAYLKKYIRQFGEPNIGDVIYQNKGYVIDDVWDDIIALDAKNKSERLEGFSGNGQKPEALLQRIFSAITSKDDIVLDFHLGSGTTAATAHKMGRQYIGVEQMDYINTVAVPRLEKVIEGDQGGISKDVGWQGGGSFVYCELKELNETYVREIQSANSKEEIEYIKAEIVGTGFISHKVDIKEIAGKNAEFDVLSLDQQKQFLMELIDKNKLYVNYSEVDDEDMKVSAAEKTFSRSFYSREN